MPHAILICLKIDDQYIHDMKKRSYTVLKILILYILLSGNKIKIYTIYNNNLWYKTINRIKGRGAFLSQKKLRKNRRLFARVTFPHFMSYWKLRILKLKLSVVNVRFKHKPVFHELAVLWTAATLCNSQVHRWHYTCCSKF